MTGRRTTAIAAIAAGVVAWTGVAAAEPRMLKGPYLQDLTPTSVIVMWQLERPAPARLVVTGPGGERVQIVEATRIAEARVEGLAPSSRYRYRVELDGGASWDGDLRTAPPVGTDVPFTYIVVGDTRYGMEAHRRVVERMMQEVPDFILGTGDMVDDGSRHDQWQQFFDVENPLLRNNVYFPALGNHDRQGRGRSADAYRAYFSVPENGGETERYYAFSYGASRFLVLDSNIYSFALTDQTAWLERELIAARSDPSVRHVFVVMHHPPFSVSLHGGARDLRERWTPLFEKYQVSAVYSGHDHVYERAEHAGIRYFVSGGGGAPTYARRPRPHPADAAAVKKYERVHHFLRVTVTGPRVEVAAIRTDGTTIETTTWLDGPASPAPAPAPSPPAVHAGDDAPPAARVAGAPRPAPPATAARAAVAGRGAGAGAGGALVWWAIGGSALLLAAAVAVVRTLRR